MTDGGILLGELVQERAVQRAEDVVERASVGLRAALPPWALEHVMGLERWQWLALPVLVLLALLMALALVRLTEVAFGRLARRTETTLDDAVVASLHPPLRLFWFSLLTRVGLGALALPDAVDEGLHKVLRVGVTLAFFWGLLRATSAWADHFTGSAWATARPGSRALVSLATQVARFALIGLGLLTGLSELGYSVTSVLAGLGLGGLALALGAQKTLEHVFGAFALAVDQPFREGDFIQAEGVMGTVEQIGLRSTRIRTLDRTLVTIPNGRLSELRLESHSARDRIYFTTNLSLRWSTTVAQLKAVREAVEQRLLAEPLVDRESVRVRFAQIAPSALVLEVLAYLQTTDYERFRVVREALLLSFLEAVEQAGTRLAYPTTTLELERVPRPPTTPSSP